MKAFLKAITMLPESSKLIIRIEKLPSKIKELLPGAIIQPIFLSPPNEARLMTLNYSHFDYRLWLKKRQISEKWPYMNKQKLFLPDFKKNQAVEYCNPLSVDEVCKELNNIAELSKKIKQKNINNEKSLQLDFLVMSLQSLVGLLQIENMRFNVEKRNNIIRLIKEEKKRIMLFLNRCNKLAFENQIKPPGVLLNSFVLKEKLTLLDITLDHGQSLISKNTIDKNPKDILHNQILVHLPEENAFSFQQNVLNELKKYRRDNKKIPLKNEIEIGENWSVVLLNNSSAMLQKTEKSFFSYMKNAFGVKLKKQQRSQNCRIIIGTRHELSDFARMLKSPKDYRLKIEKNVITVCGYDEEGARFGLYDIEARMNLIEAPFLQSGLDITRHSLYKTRIVFSYMGWDKWTDKYLEILPRYGIDAIFISPYANIIGKTRYRNVGHLQSPQKVKSIIERAKKYGLKIYCQFINQVGSKHVNKTKLIQTLIKRFPEVNGYFLLTEGFSGRVEDIKKITDIAHKLKPDLEIIPWNYNGPVTPEGTKEKLKFIADCPIESIPMLTWVKACKQKFKHQWRYVYDYSISVIGPAEEWAKAQIEIARKKGHKDIYARADNWNNWQFGTLPYLPLPQQWIKRFKSLQQYGITGTLDSWSYGFNPNFIAELKYWSSWSNAPSYKSLLKQIASREFGAQSIDDVIGAWEYFSNAIRLVPDTGHGILCNACAAPIFFEKPQLRMWENDFQKQDWKKSVYDGRVNPYWPYCPQWAFLFPDFSNKSNRAELYARSYLANAGYSYGEKGFSLDLFLEQLLFAAEEMEKGLILYRKAALNTHLNKRENALRQLLLAEQIRRMILSEHAILNFENLRFNLHKNSTENTLKKETLFLMQKIIKEEHLRTVKFLECTERDSRIGFEWENDYFYTPYVLRKKIEILNHILNILKE